MTTRRLATMAFALSLVASGCTGSTDGPTASTTSAVAPTTTLPVLTKEQAQSRLLRLDDIRSIVAFGFDVREQPVVDPKQFSLTSLRGPCGATIDTAFLSEGALRVFRSTVALIIEDLAQPGEEGAAELVGRLSDDLRASCPAFDEEVGSEGPSSVELIGPIELPPVGEARVAWAQRVTAPDGGVGYRYEVAVRQSGRLLLIAVLSTPEQASDRLVELTKMAAEGAFKP